MNPQGGNMLLGFEKRRMLTQRAARGRKKGEEACWIIKNQGNATAWQVSLIREKYRIEEDTPLWPRGVFSESFPERVLLYVADVWTCD